MRGLRLNTYGVLNRLREAQGLPYLRIINRAYSGIPVSSELINNIRELMLGNVTIILGVAGSGKTTTLIKMVRASSTPTSIVTFNRAAAEEVRERLGWVDGISVKTIDSLAVSAVYSSGHKILEAAPGGYNIRDLNERIEVTRAYFARRYNIPYSFDAFTASAGNILFSGLDYVINIAGEGGLQQYLRNLEALGCSDCSNAIRDYVGYLKDYGYDYTFARLAASSALEKHLINGKIIPRVLAIDEIQDVTPLALKMLLNLHPDAHELILAGDLDQLIYRDFGAIPDILLRIYNDIEKGVINGRVIINDTSYRLTKGIADYANLIISGVSNRIKIQVKGRPDAHGLVHVVGISELLNNLQHDVNIGRVLITAPTNDVLLDITLLLLANGYMPIFAKAVPHIVKDIIKIVLDFSLSTNDEERLRIFKIYDEVKAKIAWELYLSLNSELLKLYTPHSGRYYEALFDALGIKAEVRNGGIRIMDYLLTLDKARKNAHIIVDTPYAVKGLEFETVYICNFTRSKAAVAQDEWDVRVLYVAITRSKGSVYIIPPPSRDYREWFPTQMLIDAAKRVGVYAG